jgi:succinate dehydrogenase/fumarate reductase flavoprotein subunit
VLGREGVSRLTELELYVKQEAVRLGATWYHEHDATVLVQNEAGDVIGAIAKRPDGTYTKFLANKGVLLATGDFAANPDMCWQLLTETPEWAGRVGQTKDTVVGRSTCDGIGHKMGCWAGGFIEQHPRPTMKNGGGPGGPWGTAPFLWLNAHGKRYMGESSVPAAYSGTLRQPLGVLATVTDSKWMQTVQGATIDHGSPNWGYPPAFEALEQEMSEVLGTGAEGKQVRGVAIINMTMSMGSVVYAAETLDELADYLGYAGEAKENFLASVAAYNELCYAGEDTQFGKEANLMIPIDEAPFYGVAAQNTGNVNTGLVTLTGLVTNGDFQVLGADHTTPIQGLYAVGNCLGQRFGNQYTTPSAGASMGMAMTHGRVAGKIIASA